MPEVLRFFKDYEVFIYLILGILAVWQLRKFILAWAELRSAAFGLEQESARRRLNWAVSTLVLILFLAVAEFGLVSVVVPNYPGTLPTPTLDLLATPTATLEGTQAVMEGGPATPAPTPLPLEADGCVPGQIEILSPEEGETVQEVVEIRGSADVANFGFYKFEVTSAQEINWQTIQAGDEPVQDDQLGFWDTTRFAPGEYILRLIVTDNQGEASAPCSVRLRVEAPPEE